MQQKTISNKKVLLVANASFLDEEMILHGINLSKRMDASLEVLHLIKDADPSEVAKGFRQQSEHLNPDTPIAYIQLMNDRGLTMETVEYAKERRNIVCVVLCLQGEGVPRKKGKRQQKFREVTQLLNCPVVLYADSSVDH